MAEAVAEAVEAEGLCERVRPGCPSLAWVRLEGRVERSLAPEREGERGREREGAGVYTQASGGSAFRSAQGGVPASLGIPCRGRTRHASATQAPRRWRRATLFLVSSRPGCATASAPRRASGTGAMHDVGVAVGDLDDARGQCLCACTVLGRPRPPPSRRSARSTRSAPRLLRGVGDLPAARPWPGRVRGLQRRPASFPQFGRRGAPASVPWAGCVAPALRAVLAGRDPRRGDRIERVRVRVRVRGSGCAARMVGGVLPRRARLRAERRGVGVEGPALQMRMRGAVEGFARAAWQGQRRSRAAAGRRLGAGVGAAGNNPLPRTSG